MVDKALTSFFLRKQEVIIMTTKTKTTETEVKTSETTKTTETVPETSKNNKNNNMSFSIVVNDTFNARAFGRIIRRREWAELLNGGYWNRLVDFCEGNQNLAFQLLMASAANYRKANRSCLTLVECTGVAEAMNYPE